jgi:transposase
MENELEVCMGVDVGKASHHVTGIVKDTGEIIIDEKVDQSEDSLRRVFSEAKKHGKVHVVVDQPGSMSALLIAVAGDMGIEVGYITPKAMSRAADLYGGDLKTDARDAFIIADISMRIPELVHEIRILDDVYAELSSILSYDRALTTESTRVINRLRDLLLSIHPALERSLAGQMIQDTLTLLLLRKYGGPQGLRRTGCTRVKRWVLSNKGMGKAAAARVDGLFDVISRQELSIPNTSFIESLVSAEAKRLIEVLEARAFIAKRRDELLEYILGAEILMSLPGVGPITAATFFVEVGDISRFESSAQLASYACLAPKVRQSGKTVNSSSKPKNGNRRLKRVLMLSAQISILHCPESKKYYEKKRAEGFFYKQAIVALARKRLDVMYAMLRDGKKYAIENG